MRRTREQERVAGEVEAALARSFPEVELVDLDVHGGAHPTLTLYIDAPQGVDLELCAAVSAALDELRETYSLEVSSPGLDRPLTRPAHFERFVGRLVAVRTAAAVAGRRVFSGRLTSAGPDGIELALEDGGETHIQYDDITRAHVVHEYDTGGGRHE